MSPRQRTGKTTDPDERFVLRLCATYLGRVLPRLARLDATTVQFVFWVLGQREAGRACRFLAAELGAEARAALAGELEDCDDAEELATAVARRLRRGPRRLTRRFVGFLERALEGRVRALRRRGRCEAERTLERLRQMFDFSEKEAEYCLFVYLVGSWPWLERFFEDHLQCFLPPGRKHLAALLGLGPRELTALLGGKIRQLGIIDSETHWHRLSDDYLPLFQSSRELVARDLFRRVGAPAVPLERHQVDPQHTQHLVELLAAPPAEQAPGVHLLLHGPAGTGKSSYAQGLARAVGLPAYEVLPREDNRRASHRAALMACLNMTNHGQGSLVVVDEADSLLRTERGWLDLGAETSDKGWLNYLLDRPGLRMVWICNEVAGIAASVRRRFAFSVAFRAFGRAQRVQLWQTIARAHGAGNLLRRSDIAALAARFTLSAGAIDLAVRTARQTAGTCRARFLWAVRESLEAHRALLEGNTRAIDREAVAQGFLLEALNAGADLGRLLRRLEAVDRSLRERPATGGGAGPAGFRVLLHGPPGTGKSELARFIGAHLDREVLVRRASDIVSKWVGETEQNIAAAFAAAEADDALLVLDEVDTFLFGRGLASHSWEVSFTNELLTQMERFRGMLICTTNRLEGLDPAALRRFQVKLRLGYLLQPAKQLLYRSLLAPLCPSPLRPAHLRALMSIEPLAPGDFSVVRDRHATEEPGHADLLAALEQEVALRRAQQGRVAGFGR